MNTKELRVAILANSLRLPHYRGYSRYIINLLRDLEPLSKDMGLKVYTLSREVPSDVWQHSLQWTEQIVASAPRLVLWQHLLLPQILAANKIDVVHAPANHGAPFISPAKTVFTIHDTLTHDALSSSPELRNRLELMSHANILRRRSTSVVTISKTAYDSIAQRKWVDMGRLYWAYESLGSIGSSALSEPLVSKSRPSRILYVGGFEERKNVLALIEAFCTVRRALPGATLILVGYHDTAWAPIRAKIADLRLELAVTAPGYVDEDRLAELYESASILVMPSLAEGFGLPVAEAMSFGCIPLVSRRTACEELVGTQDLAFDPHDPESIAHTIITTLRRSDLFELRATLRERARELFCNDSHARAVIHAYRRSSHRCM